MSVAGSLWDQFPLVNKRAEEGKDFVAEVAGFLQKRAALEKDYAQKLIKLVTTVPAAESGTLHEAWKCMMLETEEIAKWHNGFGDAMVEDVREKILAFLRDEKIQRKTLEQNGTAVTKELQGCTEKKEKAQANFERARKQQDKSQEEYEKLNVSNQPAQVVLKAAKKLQKDIKAAEKADAAYKEAVTAMQQAQEKMYNTEMPQILEEYQVLDKKRLDLMKACLTKLVALQQSLPTLVSEKCQLMKVQAEKMDSEADIYAFIIANISSKIKPRLVEYEPYDPELGKCRGPPAPLPSLHSFSTLESSSGSHLSPSLQSASSSSSLGQEGSTQQRLPSGGQTSSGNLRKGSFSYRKGRKGTLKARGDHHSDAPEDESSESERDDSSGASSTIELAKHTPRDESGRRDTGSRERSETDFSDRGKGRRKESGSHAYRKDSTERERHRANDRPRSDKDRDAERDQDKDPRDRNKERERSSTTSSIISSSKDRAGGRERETLGRLSGSRVESPRERESGRAKMYATQRHPSSAAPRKKSLRNHGRKSSLDRLFDRDDADKKHRGGTSSSGHLQDDENAIDSEEEGAANLPAMMSIAVALHDYEGPPSSPQQERYLVFRAGDIIQVLDKDPSGWWLGEKEGVVGIFPGGSPGWVHELWLPNPSFSPDGADQHQTEEEGDDGSKHHRHHHHHKEGQVQGLLPATPLQETPLPEELSGYRCQAIFPFEPENEDELLLKPGDVLTITQALDHGQWYHGYRVTDEAVAAPQQGRFPANYVVILAKTSSSC